MLISREYINHTIFIYMEIICLCKVLVIKCFIFNSRFQVIECYILFDSVNIKKSTLSQYLCVCICTYILVDIQKVLGEYTTNS